VCQVDQRNAGELLIPESNVARVQWRRRNAQPTRTVALHSFKSGFHMLCDLQCTAIMKDNHVVVKLCQSFLKSSRLDDLRCSSEELYPLLQVDCHSPPYLVVYHRQRDRSMLNMSRSRLRSLSFPDEHGFGNETERGVSPVMFAIDIRILK
jgi:hypothetical protein